DPRGPAVPRAQRGSPYALRLRGRRRRSGLFPSHPPTATLKRFSSLLWIGITFAATQVQAETLAHKHAEPSCPMQIYWAPKRKLFRSPTVRCKSMLGIGRDHIRKNCSRVSYICGRHRPAPQRPLLHLSALGQLRPVGDEPKPCLSVERPHGLPRVQLALFGKTCQRRSLAS